MVKKKAQKTRTKKPRIYAHKKPGCDYNWPPLSTTREKINGIARNRHSRDKKGDKGHEERQTTNFSKTN